MLRFLALVLNMVAAATMDSSTCLKAMQSEDPPMCKTHVCNANSVLEDCPRKCNPNYKCLCAPVTCSKCDNAGCLAQQLGCDLFENMIAHWPGDAKNGKFSMSKVRRQMLSICMHGKVGDDSDSVEANTDAVGLALQGSNNTGRSLRGLARKLDTCPADKCTPNVVDYLHQNTGAKLGMEMATDAATAAIATVEGVLTAGAGIAANLAVGFVGAFVGNFFPGQAHTTNPCTNVKKGSEWGQCVWQQVEPFVKQYVAEEIQDNWALLLKKTLQGLFNQLTGAGGVYTTAYLNLHNGFPKETTITQMYNTLNGISGAMDRDAPKFFDADKGSKAAGLYGSQFAALHISIMTSLFSSGASHYSNPGDNFKYMQKTACYANASFWGATNAKTKRLESIKESITPGSEQCSYFDCSGPHIMMCTSSSKPCPTKTRTYTDSAWTSKGDKCTWKYDGVRFGGVGRVSNFYGCLSCASDRVDSSSVPKCFEDYRQNVIKQIDTMWLYWLSPLPYWLELAIKMHHKEEHLKGVQHYMLDCNNLIMDQE